MKLKMKPLLHRLELFYNKKNISTTKSHAPYGAFRGGLSSAENYYFIPRQSCQNL